jgi:hypothetical protein
MVPSGAGLAGVTKPDASVPGALRAGLSPDAAAQLGEAAEGLCTLHGPGHGEAYKAAVAERAVAGVAGSGGVELGD